MRLTPHRRTCINFFFTPHKQWKIFVHLGTYLNPSAKMWEKVGPIAPSATGVSRSPPTYKSTSSRSPYRFISSDLSSFGMLLLLTWKWSLNLTYGGRPWSLPRWIFIATRSAVTPGPGFNFIVNAHEKNLLNKHSTLLNKHNTLLNAEKGWETYHRPSRGTGFPNYTRYKFQCHRSFALGPSSPHCPSPSPLHFVRSISRPVPFHTLKWRGRKKCVAQEHNKMSPTKAEVTCGLVSVTIHSMLPINFPGRLFQHSIQDTIHTSLL